MRVALYIAGKFIKGRESKRISRPIVLISLLSVLLGFAVMLLSVSIVTGFQKEIRDKVIGFGSHIRISPIQMSTDAQDIGVPLDQPFLKTLRQIPGVKHVQPSALKPAILQTVTDTITEEDGPSVRYSIHGIVCKGTGTDFNWDFFTDKLVQGRLPHPDSSGGYDMLISDKIAAKMKLSTGQRADVYFFRRGTPTKRKFNVCGVYHTGLEDFDEQFVFIDMEHVQKLNDWGVQVTLELKDTCLFNSFIVEASCTGGPGGYLYNWGQGWNTHNAFRLCPVRDTTIMVIASGYGPGYSAPEPETISDTAWLQIKVNGPANCMCNLSENEAIPAHYGEDGMYRKLMPDSTWSIETRMNTSQGSHRYYTNGFEVQLESWNDLQQADELIHSGHIGPGFETQTITDQHPEIFSWLGMLDINVIIIIVLVIIVAVVNMSSAMLVLILERTNAIGILKAMGASNWTIRKIFLWNAVWLAGGGLLAGNLVGLGLIILQQETGLVPLNQEAYFLSEIPVDLNWGLLLALNIGTLVLCAVMLILPSWFVTRITPVKAIRFE